MKQVVFGLILFLSLPSFSDQKRLTRPNYPQLPESILAKNRSNEKNKVSQSEVDPKISEQWGLSHIGFFESFTPLAQPIKTGTEPCSKAVVVAVVDTGIDYTHPDLMNNIWVNPGESGSWEPSSQSIASHCHDKSCNGIDDDNNGFIDDVVGWDFVNDSPLPYDTHGHGTHIAGIISAESGNGLGVSGVCPGVTIMPLKYYDNSGMGYNNLQNTVRAIQYAVKNGAQIINYSGGGSDPAITERIAIEEAYRKGVLFVAAAGNDGHNNETAPYYPASYPLDNIISVASVNRQGQLLPSSNFGKTVMVAAPGLSVLSTLPQGQYGTMSGTSQATAFVSGLAALLVSQSSSVKDFNYLKVKSWITSGARALKNNDRKNLVSGGLISVNGSLELRPKDINANSSSIALAPRSKTKTKKLQ